MAVFASTFAVDGTSRAVTTVTAGQLGGDIQVQVISNPLLLAMRDAMTMIHLRCPRYNREREGEWSWERSPRGVMSYHVPPSAQTGSRSRLNSAPRPVR